MARNQAILAQLDVPLLPCTRSTRSGRKSVAKRTSVAVAQSNKPSTSARRSTRLSGAVPDAVLGDDDTTQRVERKRKRATAPAMQKVSASSGKVSISDINIDLPKAGETFQVNKSGMLRRLAAKNPAAKFSCLSGIQQFKDAIVLFINCDG